MMYVHTGLSNLADTTSSMEPIKANNLVFSFGMFDCVTATAS